MESETEVANRSSAFRKQTTGYNNAAEVDCAYHYNDVFTWTKQSVFLFLFTATFLTVSTVTFLRSIKVDFFSELSPGIRTCYQLRNSVVLNTYSFRSF